MPKHHARRRAKKSERKMCKLTIVNKAGDVVAEGVTPENFAAFKKQQGRERREVGYVDRSKLSFTHFQS